MSSQTADSPGLCSLKNYYFLGFHKKLAEEASNVKMTNDQLAQWSDIYKNRDLLVTDPLKVFKTIDENATTALTAIKKMAAYKTASVDNKELALDSFKEFLSMEGISDDITAQILGSQVFFEEEDYKEALKLVVDAGENLEKLAASAQIYLKLNRLSLAQACTKKMSELDDDDTLAQLATSWTQIHSNNEAKINEAVPILQELIQKFGPSVVVLNTLGACQMKLKNFSSAVDYLKQANQLARKNKEAVPADTLINTIICLQYLGLHQHHEIIGRVETELKMAHPENAWSKQEAVMSDLFDQHAANYS